MVEHIKCSTRCKLVQNFTAPLATRITKRLMLPLSPLSSRKRKPELASGIGASCSPAGGWNRVHCGGGALAIEFSAGLQLFWSAAVPLKFRSQSTKAE